MTVANATTSAKISLSVEASVRFLRTGANVTADFFNETYTTAFASLNKSLPYRVSLTKVSLTRSDVRTTIVYRSSAAWVTLAVVIMILSILIKEDSVSPDVVMMLALFILLCAGVITVQQSLAGFANEGIATIGILYLVALGISNSGVLDLVSRYVLGTPATALGAVIRLTLPIAILSGVLNNTVKQTFF